MTATTENRGILLCPICRSEVTDETLDAVDLGAKDFSIIDSLVNEHLLMQVIELGKLSSKYFRPETIASELQVKESLNSLSDKATELMDKQVTLSSNLVKASEATRKKVTEEAIREQRQLVTSFQEELRRMQHQQVGLEQERKRELELINAAIQQIQQKIVGVGIGPIRELSVIKELKSASPEDDFSDDKARKHGADIIAKVRFKGADAGTIVVSIKEEKNWSEEFIDQLKRNVLEERTDCGMLVTRAFPNSALNEKLYIDGNGFLVVKTEYAAAAYVGLRYAAIYKYQQLAIARSLQETAHIQEHVAGALESWVQGTRLMEVLSKLQETREASIQTDDLMQKLQTYSDRTIKSTRELQSKIRGFVQETDLILAELKEQLPIKL